VLPVSEVNRRRKFITFKGHVYPLNHWEELSPFIVGEEKDPKGIFLLVDDVWPAEQYSENPRAVGWYRYCYHFGHLRSWLKPYVKHYCYHELLGRGLKPLGAAPHFPYKLTETDRYIVDHGVTLDDLAIPDKFEALWDAQIGFSEGKDGDKLLPEAVVCKQRLTRPFWFHMSGYFGSPSVIPPVPPYRKANAAETGADKSKLIPSAVTRQLVNRLALHRDRVAMLNPYHHLRLCVMCLVICLGRRIEEVLAAPRGKGARGPLERYPCRSSEGKEVDALWFRFRPNKSGPSEWVYISPEWEELAVYCVRELIRYGDEVRRLAAESEQPLLILASTWNWTRTAFARRSIPVGDDHDFSLLGAHGGKDRGPRSRRIKKITKGIMAHHLNVWLNGQKVQGKFIPGIMHEWNITADGSPDGPVYRLTPNQARYTRQTVLTRDKTIAPLIKQHDLNHTDINFQLDYQHALDEENAELVATITESPLAGCDPEFFYDLLEGARRANENGEGRGSGLVQLLTPRWQRLLSDNPRYFESNKVPPGICREHGGPGGCALYRRARGPLPEIGQGTSRTRRKPSVGDRHTDAVVERPGSLAAPESAGTDSGAILKLLRELRLKIEKDGL
jgi:hypothetical protein